MVVWPIAVAILIGNTLFADPPFERVHLDGVEQVFESDNPTAICARCVVQGSDTKGTVGYFDRDGQLMWGATYEYPCVGTDGAGGIVVLSPDSAIMREPGTLTPTIASTRRLISSVRGTKIEHLFPNEIVVLPRNEVPWHVTRYSPDNVYATVGAAASTKGAIAVLRTERKPGATEFSSAIELYSARGRVRRLVHLAIRGTRVLQAGGVTCAEDGTVLVLVGAEDKKKPGYIAELCLVGIDKHHQVRLLCSWPAAWCPTSNGIATSSDGRSVYVVGGKNTVYVFAADSLLRSLAKSPSQGLL
jgi:hypothetical protein